MDIKTIDIDLSAVESIDSDFSTSGNNNNGKKIKKKRKVGKIFAVIGAVIAAIILIANVTNIIGNSANMKLAKSFSPVKYETQLIPGKDNTGDMFFKTDRDFKILQLTDIHLGGGWLSFSKDASAIKAVADMVTAEAPDLVIVTGDIAYPVPFQAGTFNNKTGARLFANLMESLGVYWTLGFGNHDTEVYSFYSRDKIASFYSGEEFKHCIFQSGPSDVSGSGNQVIKILKSDGRISRALFIFDSHSYTNGDYLGIRWEYDNIHDDQIKWYKTKLAEINSEDKSAGGKGNVKSFAFFLIPLTEYRDAWSELRDNGWKDTENVKYLGGIAGEKNGTVYCGINEDDVFETFENMGSTQAVFCGHDHFNNFTVHYKKSPSSTGIDLVYSYSIDYLAYIGISKKGSQRGCTAITSRDSGKYEIVKHNYYADYPRTDKSSVIMQFKDVKFECTE